MKTFEEFLKLEESNRKPKWNGKANLLSYGIDLENLHLDEFKYDYSEFDLNGDDFYCSKNKLTSLEGSPKVCRDFYCNTNQLTELVGSPDKVLGTFDCSDNPMKSLKGIPEEIGGDFICLCVGLREVSPILNCEIGGKIKFGNDSVQEILNKYKNNPKNLIKMLVELKKIDKRYC